jgi:hypothetical protein
MVEDVNIMRRLYHHYRLSSCQATDRDPRFLYGLTALIFLISAFASLVVALCYYAGVLRLDDPYQIQSQNNGLNYSPTHSPLLGTGTP